MKKTEQQTIIERLVDVEQSLPVYDLTLDEIELWPLARFLVHKYMRPQLTYTGARPPLKQDTIAFNAPLPAPARREAQTARLAGEAPLDLLYVSRVESHSERVGGRLFDRLGDSMLLFAEAAGKAVAKVEVLFQPPPDAGLPERFIPSAASLPSGPWTPDPPTTTLTAHLPPDLIGRIEQGLGAKFDFQQLARQAVGIWRIAQSWRTLIERARPRVVILQCYYYPSAYACVYACRRLSIPVVDMQHGQQGLNHLMYTHWTTAPRGGFKLRPSWFWAWGEPSADAMRRPPLPEGRAADVVVGGNPWLALWRSGVQSATNETISRFRNIVAAAKAAGRKCVLLALQPSATPFNDHVLEAMRTAQDLFWLIRLHPNQFGWKDQALKLLSETNIENFDMELSSNVALFEIVKNCSFVVTEYSSVVREATSLGLPSVITNPVAEDMYGADIDDLWIRRGYDVATLKAGMERAASPIGSTATESRRPFIESDPAIVRQAIDRITTAGVALRR